MWHHRLSGFQEEDEEDLGHTFHQGGFPGAPEVQREREAGSPVQEGAGAAQEHPWNKGCVRERGRVGPE